MAGDGRVSATVSDVMTSSVTTVRENDSGVWAAAVAPTRQAQTHGGVAPSAVPGMS